jgi:hypothetical protein
MSTRMSVETEGPKRDLAMWVFLSVLAVAGIIYVYLGLTPSSYGVVLTQLGAPEQGPILGSPRDIRSDEWAVITPLFQTAVRNEFREVNETSFYREDLRSMFPVPLRNWTLFLRPQLWAFFLTAAPTAYSIYFAFLICASLAGYTLLIRELGAQGFVAAAVSVVIFFSGLFQFWGLWSLAGVPWILLILVSRMKWWHKALLYAWLMPATALAHCYPPFFIDLALVALVLALAIRRDWFRSASEIAAVAIGAVVTCCVLYAYYAKLIPILANTVYPGHRIAPPGTVPVSLVLSQFFPFLTIVLSGYQHLAGLNLVEGGTIGSFLPVLTLCLARFRDFWNNRPLRIAVMILLSAAAVMTLWQAAPLPPWVGRIFLWDTALPERLFYATGILLNIASALLWSNKLITLHPLRILVFFLAGPVAAVILKLSLFRIALSGIRHDVAICCLVMIGCVIACYLGAARRAGVLLTIVAMTNLFEFGRFNPLQPAAPIFNVPETPVFLALRREELSTPGHILLDARFFGSTLNGMGFRAVVHVLPAPQLEFFRKYFPTMDAERFNSIFNRYAHIELSEDRLPSTPYQDVALLPAEVFRPIRNSRRVSSASGQWKACLIPAGGAVDRIIAQGPHLTIMGWAPWKGESAMQGIRVVSPRALRADSLVTVERADIAELMQDYAYVKSGFRLRLSSMDGRPVRPEKIVIVAGGTPHGDVRVGRRACP